MVQDEIIVVHPDKSFRRSYDGKKDFRENMLKESLISDNIKEKQYDL